MVDVLNLCITNRIHVSSHHGDGVGGDHAAERFVVVSIALQCQYQYQHQYTGVNESTKKEEFSTFTVSFRLWREYPSV